MKINTKKHPQHWRAQVTIDGVSVGPPQHRFCFEADEEAGVVRCDPAIEVAPGYWAPDVAAIDRGEVLEYTGVVVITLPEDMA